MKKGHETTSTCLTPDVRLTRSRVCDSILSHAVRFTGFANRCQRIESVLDKADRR